MNCFGMPLSGGAHRRGAAALDGDNYEDQRVI